MKIAEQLLTTENILRNLGFRITSTRIVLVNMLRKSKQPQTIAQITANLADTGIDKTTMYRNLIILQQRRLVREVDLHQEQTYFEWNDEHEHHHVVCVRCKHIQDVTGCAFESIKNTVLNQASDFSKILEHSFEVFGVCKSCAKQAI